MRHKGSCTVWLLSTFVTVGAVLCGKLNWCSALAGTALAFLLYNIVGTEGKLPGILRAVQVLWLAVPLAVAVNGATALFPDASNPYYVPVVVLALSWLLARQNREGVLACCTVVSFFVLAAVAVVTVFAAPDLQWQWLMPTFDWRSALIAFAIGAGAMMLCEVCPGTKPALIWRIVAFLAPVIFAALSAGCLSPALSVQQESAFYTLSRSISVFGVVERFEALIAACLSLGICSACTLVLHSGRQLIPAKGQDAVTALLCVAALFGSVLPSSGVIPAAGTVILWILLPFCKIIKKREKSS